VRIESFVDTELTLALYSDPIIPLMKTERGGLYSLSTAKSLQKLAAVHASIHNHFNQQRHFYSRKNFKLNRSASLVEWCQLAA
jgi:putative transposase